MKLFLYLLTLTTFITFGYLPALPVFSDNELSTHNCIEKEVTFKNKEGLTLSGSLIIPKGTNPAPVVLHIFGTGDFNRSITPETHKDLAKNLVQKGIGSLIVDKRKNKKSEKNKDKNESSTTLSNNLEPFSQVSLNESMNDALTALDFLLQLKEIDHKNIGIVTHSEGTMIGPMVAKETNKLAFIVLLAPIAVTGKEIVLDQTTTYVRYIQNLTPEEKIFLLTWLEVLLNKQEYSCETAKKDILEAVKNWDVIAENIISGLVQLIRCAYKFYFKPQVIPTLDDCFTLKDSPQLQSFINHDPAPYLTQLRIPTLAVFADNDMQVNTKLNQPKLEQHTKACPDVTIQTICNLDQGYEHYFTQKQKTSLELLETVVAWIERKTKNSIIAL